jgi:hypothetical protein
MKEHWTPSTIGALVILIGGVALRCFGINTEIWSLTTIAAGFLFGEQYQIIKTTKSRQNKK